MGNETVVTMNARLAEFSSKEFRLALGRFPTGVTVITASLPGQPPVGLTISSFNSVSLDPPLVFWALSRNSSSRAVLEQCERYVIHVLTADQFDLAMRFASGTHKQRFEGIDLQRTDCGTIKLGIKVAAWFECFNHSHSVQGDHLLFLGQVEQCHHSSELPLIYHAGGYDLTPNR